MKDVGPIMSRIADDGEMTPDKLLQLQKVMLALAKVSKVATEVQIYMEKFEGERKGGARKF